MTGQLTMEIPNVTGKTYINGGYIQLVDLNGNPKMPSFGQDVVVMAYLAQEISTEAAAREGSDNSISTALSSQMSSEQSYRIAGDASVSTLVATEVTRATDAEVVLAGDISDEITDRSTAVASEMSARVAGDNSISTALSSEIERAISGETSLSTGISLAASRALYNEGSLGIAITAEATARQSVITALGSVYVDVSGDTMTGQLTMEIPNVTGKTYINGGYIQLVDLNGNPKMPSFGQDVVVMAYLAQEISTEAAAREGSDNSISTALSSQMSSEQSYRIAGDASVSTLVATEVTRATDAEVVLAGDISDEITDRSTAVASEMSARVAGDNSLSTALASEMSDRVAGDNSLASDISTEKARVDAILLASDADRDSFVEIVSLINSVDTTNDNAFAGYVISNNSALSTEISRATSAEGSLNGALSSEYNRASTVETNISNALVLEIADRIANVNAEVNRAMGVEASLSTALLSEMGEREAGDNSLSTALSSQMSTEASSRINSDNSLSTAVASEISRAIYNEGILANQISAETTGRIALSGALAPRVTNLENNKYDKTGGTVSGEVTVTGGLTANGFSSLPGAIFDPAGEMTFSPLTETLTINVLNGNGLVVIGPMSAGNIQVANIIGADLNINGFGIFQGGMEVSGSAEFANDVVMSGSVKVGANQLEIVPVVAVLATSGIDDTTDVSSMFDDLASFTGMVMANFQVVAASTTTGGGMTGEYRVSAYCNGGQLSNLSVVELAQEMVGGAYLDVDFLTDGTVRVVNGPNETESYMWHVQRVKMVAVDANGAVK